MVRNGINIIYLIMGAAIRLGCLVTNNQKRLQSNDQYMFQVMGKQQSRWPVKQKRDDMRQRHKP